MQRVGKTPAGGTLMSRYRQRARRFSVIETGSFTRQLFAD
jgi:hypothetical protein